MGVLPHVFKEFIVKTVLKVLLLTFMVSGFITISGPSFAGGSDSPTPYSVTVDGIEFPYPLEAHGHVNVRTDTASYGIHFDPNNGHPGGQWIGESFLPWSAFGITEGCVVWVQWSAVNEHFGEGGQEPVCLYEPEPEPTAEHTREPEPTAEPTAEPTVEPTEEPSPEPSLSPEPSVEPTIEPSEEPEPTVEPTPDPTITPESVVDPTTEPAEPLTPETSTDPEVVPTPERDIEQASSVSELAQTGVSWSSVFAATILIGAGVTAVWASWVIRHGR